MKDFPPDLYARTDLYYPIFAQMALESFQRASSLFCAPDAHGSGGEPEDQHAPAFANGCRIQQDCIVTVSFAAMAIEGFLYDLSVYYLGDERTQDEIDSKHLEEKWEILPRLIFHQKLDRGGELHCLLKETVKQRNRYVHCKTKDMPTRDGVFLVTNIDFEKDCLTPAYRALLALAKLEKWLHEIGCSPQISFGVAQFGQQFSAAYKNCTSSRQYFVSTPFKVGF